MGTIAVIARSEATKQSSAALELSLEAGLLAALAMTAQSVVDVPFLPRDV
jgi:hypothetical protein